MWKVKYGEESGYADWYNSFEVHKLAVDVEGKLRPTNRLLHEENIKSESKNIERPENVAKNLCVRAKRIHFHKYILIIGKSFDHNISNLAIDIWKN